MKNLLITLLLALVFGHVTSAFALLPGESIVLDPVSGDYTFTYWDEEGAGSFQKYTLIPSNKIDPAVKSGFKLGENGIINYGYSVKNGEKSRQPLTVFALDPVSDIVSSIPLPKSQSELGGNLNRIPEYFAASKRAVEVPNSNWSGSADVSLERAYGLRISWIYNTNLAVPPSAKKTMSAREIITLVDAAGLQKGKTQDGFVFLSRDLPGIVMAQLEGHAPMTGFSGEGPTGEISGKLLELEKNNTYVTRPAAVPTIPVPSPFDPAILLDRIQTQTHTWIAMQLLDATFSAQLNRYLVAAADAYRHNQPKAGKEHIETLRKMLKKEHEDLGRDEERESENSRENDEEHKSKMISRLAARVLDFDLRYMLKRMDDDGDHERERKK